MMKEKRKNWMLTIWSINIPRFIQELDGLIIAYTQKEITTEGCRIHWQTFCEFKGQVTKATLKAFFDKHKTKCHIGQKKDMPEIKTKLQGLQYVSGYGPLALSKLVCTCCRFIITPEEVLQKKVEDEYLEKWKKLSEMNRLRYQLRKNAEDSQKIFDWQTNKHRIMKKKMQ